MMVKAKAKAKDHFQGQDQGQGLTSLCEQRFIKYSDLYLYLYNSIAGFR